MKSISIAYSLVHSCSVQQCVPSPSAGTSAGVKCPHCNAFVPQLSAHMQVAHADMENVCTECSRACGTRAQLTRHMADVHGRRVFVCGGYNRHVHSVWISGECNVGTFRSRHGLMRHRQTHASAPVLESTVATPSSTTTHVVTRKTSFQCDRCTFTARNRPHLYEHKRLKHSTGDESAKRHVCTECGARFMYNSLMQRHYTKVRTPYSQSSQSSRQTDTPRCARVHMHTLRLRHHRVDRTRHAHSLQAHAREAAHVRHVRGVIHHELTVGETSTFGEHTHSLHLLHCLHRCTMNSRQRHAVG